jgi:hypothetical protein
MRPPPGSGGKLGGKMNNLNEKLFCSQQIFKITVSNMNIHNILSTAPQLNISQKVLGKLPEDGNVMPKHVGVTIHN